MLSMTEYAAVIQRVIETQVGASHCACTWSKAQRRPKYLPPFTGQLMSKKKLSCAGGKLLRERIFCASNMTLEMSLDDCAHCFTVAWRVRHLTPPLKVKENAAVRQSKSNLTRPNLSRKPAAPFFHGCPKQVLL